MQKFSAWIPYAHRVKAFVSDVQGVKKIVPVPPNQDTINILFKENISSEDEMDAWLNKSRPDLEGKAPANGEEMSLSRVGTHLYEKASSILGVFIICCRLYFFVRTLFLTKRQIVTFDTSPCFDKCHET